MQLKVKYAFVCAFYTRYHRTDMHAHNSEIGLTFLFIEEDLVCVKTEVKLFW